MPFFRQLTTSVHAAAERFSDAIHDVGTRIGPRDRSPPDPDEEFLGGAYAEDEVTSLDFDNAIESRALHEREPESDFDTLDDHMPAFVDVAEATDALGDIGVFADAGLMDDEPL